MRIGDDTVGTVVTLIGSQYLRLPPLNIQITLRQHQAATRIIRITCLFAIGCFDRNETARCIKHTGGGARIGGGIADAAIQFSAIGVCGRTVVQLPQRAAGLGQQVIGIVVIGLRAIERCGPLLLPTGYLAIWRVSKQDTGLRDATVASCASRNNCTRQLT